MVALCYTVWVFVWVQKLAELDIYARELSLSGSSFQGQSR